MSKASLALVATLLVGFSAHAPAAAPANSDPVHDDVELRSLIAYSTAEIRSREDLSEHLRRAGDKSPLAALPRAARVRFVDSLDFNENGLTQYRYDVLLDNLTASQAYRILRLFGAEGTGAFLRRARIETETDAAIASIRWFDDHLKAKCVSPHNCQLGWVDFICMSGC